MALTPTNVTCQTLGIEPDFSSMVEARDRFGDFLRSQGIAADLLNLWEVVFTEAVTNAINYGCQGQPSRSVKLSWGREKDVLFLRVQDPGKGPPDQLLTDPALPENPLDEGGRGMFMMKYMMDSIEGWRGREGFTLEMRKSHPGLPERSSDDPVLNHVLDELAAANENLASFYRLGPSLALMHDLRPFIQESLADFRQTHECACCRFIVNPVGGTALTVNQADEAFFCERDQLPAPLRERFETRRDFIWETPPGQPMAPGFEGLRPFGCLIPVVRGSSHYGAIACQRPAGSHPFLMPDLSPLRTLADIFSIAFSNLELCKSRDAEQRLLGELNAAAGLQRHLLPLPSIGHLPHGDLFLRRREAREVAGDHVMAQFDEQGNLWLVLIDVMGKGVSAAVLAVLFRGLFPHILRGGGEPGAVMSRLNGEFCHLLGNLTCFLACVLVRISPDGRVLAHTNAGNCPTIILDRHGEIREMASVGPPLGLFATATYSENQLAMERGDRILIVSDGCFEFPLEQGIWGWDNFLQTVREILPGGPRALWQALQARSIQTPTKEIGDDMTLVCWSDPRT